MVERGHDDGVAPDQWVAYEYAKIRRMYDKLGIGARTEIEFFNGRTRSMVSELTSFCTGI